MKNRPLIKIKLQLLDIIIEIAGWLTIIAIWGLLFVNYNDLPETIPTHFDAKGKADNFGSKDNIINLQVVLTLLFIGMTILNSFPHKLNYIVQITKENAKRQYVYATRLIRVLKLVIAFIFGLLFYKTIQNIYGEAIGLGTWFFPLTIGFFSIPIIIYLIKSASNK